MASLVFFQRFNFISKLIDSGGGGAGTLSSPSSFISSTFSFPFPPLVPFVARAADFARLFVLPLVGVVFTFFSPSPANSTQKSA